MPNGVICGGAVDGSNQLGEIVTCHAMTTRPAGAGAPAIDAPAPNSRMAAKDQPSARRKRPCSSKIMRPLLPAFVAFYMRWRRSKVSESRPRPRGGPFGKPADQELDQRGYLRRSRPSGRRDDVEGDRRRRPVLHDRFE